MSNREAAHQLIADIHGDFFGEMSRYNRHALAARALHKRDIMDGTRGQEAHFSRQCVQYVQTHHHTFFKSIPSEHSR